MDYSHGRRPSKLGSQALSLQVGAYDLAKRPDGARNG
jgi:hypothetical protein